MLLPSAANENDKTVSPIEIISCESFSKQATGRNFEIAVPDDKGIVRLPYNQNTFRITFTVADYSQNGQVDYAYIMDGQDKSWYYTKKDNTITFHNIAPGNYTFKVKARLKNNDWDEKTLHPCISLSVHPYGLHGMQKRFISYWYCSLCISSSAHIRKDSC